MPRRERKVTEDQCTQFLEDVARLEGDLFRFIHKHKDMWRTEWLGGDRDANNYEAPPERLARASKHLNEAFRLLKEADHEVVMHRAGIE